MEYRILLYELQGNGSEVFVKGDIALTGAQPTRKLSSPHSIAGTLKRGADDLVNADGSPVLKRWKTTVYAIDDNDRIFAGGILADFKINGPDLSLDVAGFTAALKGQPYDGKYSSFDIDPLNIVRMFWDHLQGQDGGNLGLQIDSTISPVRIGQESRNVNFDTSSGDNVDFTATDTQVAYNWWSTGDMGGVLDQLANDTPFDYIEEHTFDGETESISHFLRLGYPTLGARKPTLRFVLGENVRAMPDEDYSGDDVVTEVWVFGAGEGETRIRGVAKLHPRDSIRRVKIVDDKFITDVVTATNRARDILMTYQPDIPGAGITELLVSDHTNAEFGTFDVGDTVIYSGDHDWGDVLIWVRILSMTLLPGGQMRVAVTRADTLKQ